MPRFLENKLKAEYGQNSKIPYMVMNKLGAMRGNKETAKGRAMEAKHNRDMKRKLSPASAAKIRRKANSMMGGAY